MQVLITHKRSARRSPSGRIQVPESSDVMEQNDKNRCQGLNRGGTQDEGRKWAKGERKEPLGEGRVSLPTLRGMAAQGQELSLKEQDPKLPVDSEQIR